MIVRVFVAGGTGVVGRHLVPQLVARGHQVIATAISPDQLGMLEQMGAEAVVMEGLDAASVGEAVSKARPDAITHQMTAIGGKIDLKHMDQWFATTNRLRTEGTDHLLAAAEANDVSNFVAQSYAAWNGIRAGGWIKTEDDPVDLWEGTVAHPIMAAAHYVEETVGNAGGAALRFGWLYGPGASDSIIEPIRNQQFPVIGDGAGHTSWVHLDDAASATVLALEQQAKGVFNIVDDDPAPASQWLPYLAEAVGAKPPLRVPSRLALSQAGDAAVGLMTEGRGFSNAKAKRELGWQLRYPSWRRGFKEGLE